MILFIGFSCKKEVIKPGEKRLPNITEKGKGIFACYVQGDTYISRRNSPIVYNKSSGYLFVENNIKSREFRFFVYAGLFQEGIYQLDSTGEEYLDASGTGYSVYSGGINRFEISSLNVTKKYVSGTFDFDLRNNDLNEILEIRDGRFDLEIDIID